MNFIVTKSSSRIRAVNDRLLGLSWFTLGVASTRLTSVSIDRLVKPVVLVSARGHDPRVPIHDFDMAAGVIE